jgi:HAD superfamily phosphatase (TIGR01668 family)
MLRLLTPDITVAHVRDVTPALLRERGIRAVISDLDNTLVRWRGEDITDEITAWLRLLRASDISVCIASNTRHLTRLERLAAQMGILHVPGNAVKPRRRGLRRALALLQATPGETAMVGDQLFTDILAGNRLGLTSILVNPLSAHEFIGTRLISRTAERLVLRGRRKRAL